MEWGREEWVNDAKAAFAEASRRIDLAATSDDAETRQSLYLSDLVALTQLPEQIAELTDLKHLHFFGAPEGVSGPMFGALGIRNLMDFNVLADLGGLETLDLRNTGITVLDWISGLTALTSLDLSSTKIQEIEPLKTLTALTSLNLTSTNIQNIEPLQTLTALTWLDLSHTQVQDLDILLRLPEFFEERAEYLNYTNTPAAKNDRRLDLLSRLPSDRCAIETMQYLKGTHPDFRDPPAKATQTLLAAASPVQLELSDGKLTAANPGPPERHNPVDLDQRLKGQRQMTAALQAEMATAQVPPALIARLDRYAAALTHEPPIFFVMDAPMSMLRGSIADKYLTEGLDGGLIDGFHHLIATHDALAPLMKPPSDEEVAALAALPEPSDDATPEAIEELADQTVAALDETVDSSITDVVNAINDLADASREKPGFRKRALAGLGGLLAAMGSVAGIASWAGSPQGAAVLAKLQPILEIIKALFGLA